MRAGLMFRMMVGMSDTGRGHEPVHENETQQQRPDQPGLFQSQHHALTITPPPLEETPFRLAITLLSHDLIT